MIIYAVTNGYLDDVDVTHIRQWERDFLELPRGHAARRCSSDIRTKKALDDDLTGRAQGARSRRSSRSSRPSDGIEHGQGPAAQGAHPVRPEHAQDHPDDGAGGHVEAQARAGSRRRGAAVRRGAARGASPTCHRRSWPSAFPLLRQPAPPAKGGPTRAAVILLTSNRGLAGGFNANLIKEARRRIERARGRGLHGRPARRRQEGHRLLQVPRPHARRRAASTSATGRRPSTRPRSSSR